MMDWLKKIFGPKGMDREATWKEGYQRGFATARLTNRKLLGHYTARVVELQHQVQDLQKQIEAKDHLIEVLRNELEEVRTELRVERNGI